MVKIFSELLSEKHSKLIPKSYISVFEDHPWHEEFECSCGAGPYSLGCNIAEKEQKDKFSCSEFTTGKLFPIKNDDDKCYNCGEKLSISLKPIFTEKGVEEDYVDSIKKPGFIGVGAFNIEKLIGFCWGYNYPLDHPPKTGSTWYKEAMPLFEKKNINPSRIIYHNESGTLTEYRNNGVGTEILRIMLAKSSENHDFVAFRTINNAMKRCYEKAFEMKNGEIENFFVFDDPNPNKRQTWYAIDLKKL